MKWKMWFFNIIKLLAVESVYFINEKVIHMVSAAKGAEEFYTVENHTSRREGIEEARRNGEDELFIIGGGIIYEQTMHLLDKLYLTEVDLDVDGDVFFPDIKSEEWDLVSSEHHSSDEKNEHAYTFKVFERKT